MADDQLREAVEGFRTRLQAELDAQIAALTASHEEILDRARQAAEADAEERWAARLAAVRTEWDARLQTEVAAARGEVERRLVAETMRARVEAEQAAAESTADLRREMEQTVAAERARTDAERERAEAQRREAESALDEARAALEDERRLTNEAIERARQTARDLAPLVDALARIDSAGSLSDILTATSRAAAAEAPRAAIFVANGRQLDEWTADGHQPLLSGPLAADDRDAGVVGDALQKSEPASAAIEGEGSRLPVFARNAVSAFASPIVLDGRVVAVLYADDAGADPAAAKGWQGSIQILGRHAAAAIAYLTAVRTAAAMRLISAGPAATPQASSDDEPGARRYARLLVSEIKLYNEMAVRTGREKRDLLQRLAPEIERARRLYDERVPASMRARDVYFQQELVQTLAGGDATLLG